MRKKTVRHIDVANKRVLVRVDFSVPLDSGTVSHDHPHPGCSANHPVLARTRRSADPLLPPRQAKGIPLAKYSLKPVAEHWANFSTGPWRWLSIILVRWLRTWPGRG